MAAIDLNVKQGIVLGWVPGADVLRAPVNNMRAEPCHEIPVPSLRPIYLLVEEDLKFWLQI